MPQRQLAGQCANAAAPLVDCLHARTPGVMDLGRSQAVHGVAIALPGARLCVLAFGGRAPARNQRQVGRVAECDVRKLPFDYGGFWPRAGAPVGQIDATLLTFKARSDRLVWSEHLREAAAACRPLPVIHAAKMSPRERRVLNYSRRSRALDC